jgi:chromosome segregation ATPase
MPTPRSERRKLEQELAELRGQIAALENELAITVTPKIRRERLDRQIRECERRMIEVQARLAALWPKE